MVNSIDEIFSGYVIYLNFPTKRSISYDTSNNEGRSEHYDWEGGVEQSSSTWSKALW